jgi:hypothetical protein
MIPFKGIVVYNDSLLVGERLKNVLSILEKHSLKYNLKFCEPKKLTITFMDSPPPYEDGTFPENPPHQPDKYFTDWKATLKVDSLTIVLLYNHPGHNAVNKKVATDSLIVISIKITRPMNAGLNENLKIGDSFEQIFKYYEKPDYCCQPGEIVRQYGGGGVIFKIDSNKSEIDNYGKIKEIEINSLAIN